MITREIVNELNKWIWDKKILVLKWPRQVWKTTIMKEIQKSLEYNWNKTLYFSADLELWNDIFLSPKNFINFIKTQLQNKKLYIFIDEFQYIKEAWLFLKWVFDELKESIQLIVSGSSSLEITKNSEFLTGRKIDFEINWISFFEYINYFSKYKYSKYSLNDIYNVWFDISDIKYHFLEYIKYSSYPEVIITKDIKKKEAILNNIISTYISKDIAFFMKIENINAFNNLLKILSNQVWNLLNKSEISNTLNLDDRKLNYYLDILEWTYVIDLVKPYYTNIRKEISKMPKVYFQNIWVVNYFNNKNISNIDILDGSFIENVVYNFLSDITWNKENIYYYRTISKSEIDFVVKTEKWFIPIEVKYTNKVQNIPVAIKNFEQNYSNVSKKLLITKQELSFEWNNYKLPFYLLPFISNFES